MSDQIKLRLLWTWCHISFIYSVLHSSYSLIGLSIVWAILITMVGGYAGWHRYFTHRSFKTDKITEYVMFWLGVMLGLGRPVALIFFHRWHHAHSDTSDDVHSPSHLKWWQVLIGSYNTPKISKKYIKDIINDSKVKFAQRHYFKIHIIAHLILLLIDPILPGLLLASVNLYAFYTTGSIINYLSHIGGSSNNNPILALLTMGEGWHKNHHDDSSRYSNQVKWYQLDPTGWIIKYFLKRS